MALQLSTGLRNKLLDTGAFRSIFNLGFIKLYSGTPPVSADAVLSNTLLLTVSNNSTGTGLTFASGAASGAITKTLAETWSGAAASGGTATFYRLTAVGDTGAASLTEARVQGTVGLAGAEMNLPVVLLVSSSTYTIDAFSIGIPTL